MCDWQEIKADLIELIPKLKDFREDEEIKNYLEGLTEIHQNKNDFLWFIPESIKYIKNLEVLDLSENKNLIHIFKEIGELKKLRVLNLRGCNKLSYLTDAICELNELEELDLSGVDYDGKRENMLNLIMRNL